MLKILIVKSVFCPNDDFLKTNVKSIFNLIRFLSKFVLTYDFTILLIGWCSDPKYELVLKGALGKINHKVNFFKVNYGKHVIFNKIKTLTVSEKYLFYLDHDIMILPEQDDFFKPLIFLLDESINNCKIGLVSLNQLTDCRHKTDIMNSNNELVINGQAVYYSKYSEISIASGCFFTKTDYFITLEDLLLETVYGYDDKALIKAYNKLNLCCIISKDIKIIHPLEVNKDYISWKKTIMDEFDNSPCYYYKSMEKSINFWNS